jgi:hypothetical protein
MTTPCASENQCMYETVALLNVLNGSKLLILFMLWKEHLRETTTLMKYKKKTYKLTICVIEATILR